MEKSELFEKEISLIQDGQLKSVTINKNSKGVMEERKWEK